MGEGHGCGARSPSPAGQREGLRGRRGGGGGTRRNGLEGEREVRRWEGDREGDYSSILNQVQG